MKRALTIVLVALALPLAAEDAKPAQPVQHDSPLVAAAKRANRKNKKPTGIVITNESLKTSGANAHVTTTAVSTAYDMPKILEPPHPTPEMVAAQAREAERKKASEEAVARKKVDEKRDQARAAAAAAAEEGLYDSDDQDPAQAEQAQQEANQQKPPQF
jgi:hypothetical protein